MHELETFLAHHVKVHCVADSRAETEPPSFETLGEKENYSESINKKTKHMKKQAQRQVESDKIPVSC